MAADFPCKHADGYEHMRDLSKSLLCDQPSYPQHLRLEREKDRSQAIGEFLEWLGEQGVHLMHWSRSAGFHYEHVPIQKRLAQFFGIDDKELQAEKEMMLKHIRKLNQGEER